MSEDAQWIIVCFDQDAWLPRVYGAWESEHEAGRWLDEDHLTTRDADFDEDICEYGASELDHWTITVTDSG